MPAKFLLLIFLLLGSALSAVEAPEGLTTTAAEGVSEAAEVLPPLVILDAAHDETRPGVQADGLSEAALVMDLAGRTIELLQSQGLRVELTRDSGMPVSSRARVEFANGLGADALESFDETARACMPEMNRLSALLYENFKKLL